MSWLKETRRVISEQEQAFQAAQRRQEVQAELRKRVIQEKWLQVGQSAQPMLQKWQELEIDRILDDIGFCFDWKVGKLVVLFGDKSKTLQEIEHGERASLTRLDEGWIATKKATSFVRSVTPLSNLSIEEALKEVDFDPGSSVCLCLKRSILEPKIERQEVGVYENPQYEEVTVWYPKFTLHLGLNDLLWNQRRLAKLVDLKGPQDVETRIDRLLAEERRSGFK